MEKIKLSELQKVEKYRSIITGQLNGKEITIYIENPVGEKLSDLYTIISNLLEGEDVKVGDKVVNDDNIVHYLLGELTNIEVDEIKGIDVDSNIALIETISAINEIYTEIIILIYTNLTTTYMNEKKKLYDDKLVLAYKGYVEAKDKLAEEKQ